MHVRSIATLAFLLVAAPASAQIYEQWERPRNAVTLPVAGPTAVDIHLAQEQLYALEVSSNPMLVGGLAGALLMNQADGINDRQDGVAAALEVDMPDVDYGGLLQEAFERHIRPAHLADIKRITVHRSSPADVEKATPGDPDEQTLSLVVRYYLSPALRNLRIVMTARLGPRNIVTALPTEKRRPAFTQVLIYDLPGEKKEFAAEKTRRKVWTDMGGAAVSDHVRAGMEGVTAMLAYELGARPTFGRVPGKQIAWTEGPQTVTYGVGEGRIGDRALLRLRNGLLVSLPAE